MAGDFQRCVDFVIDELEGGDALVVDTGGATRFGISSSAHPGVDIKNLTRAGAEDIYLKDYWTRAGCDAMAYPLSLCVFDCAVNQGISVARGIAATSPDAPTAILNRMNVYYRLALSPKYAPFLRSWTRRLVRLWEHVTGNAKGFPV